MNLLTDGERLQSGVQKVSSFLEMRLANARAQNEGNLDIHQTNRVRGKILELKALLAAIREEHPPPADE